MAGGEDGGVGEKTVLRVGACNPQRLRETFEGKMRKRVWLRLLSQMTAESILTCIISSLLAATVASATALNDGWATVAVLTPQIRGGRRS